MSILVARYIINRIVEASWQQIIRANYTQEQIDIITSPAQHEDIQLVSMTDVIITILSDLITMIVDCEESQGGFFRARPAYFQVLYLTL